jgi:hypothetical protein
VGQHLLFNMLLLPSFEQQAEEERRRPNSGRPLFCVKHPEVSGRVSELGEKVGSVSVLPTLHRVRWA